MTKTGSIWLNPADTYAMWLGMWAAWYITALMWWMPRSGPVTGAGGRSGANGHDPEALKLFWGRDQGDKAASCAREAAPGAAGGQAVNGHGAG